MEISTSSNTITITGNIKTPSDFQNIKTRTDLLVSQNKEITILIKDSLSITSSVIGYLNKIVLKDLINLNMKIGNAQLLNLLNDLHLTSVFKATKV